jgi:hypothetical protein
MVELKHFLPGYHKEIVYNMAVAGGGRTFPTFHDYCMIGQQQPSLEQCLIVVREIHCYQNVARLSNIS